MKLFKLEVVIIIVSCRLYIKLKNLLHFYVSDGVMAP